MIALYKDSKFCGGDVYIVSEISDAADVEHKGIPIFTYEEINLLSMKPESIKEMYELKRIFGEVWLVEENGGSLPGKSPLQEKIMSLM